MSDSAGWSLTESDPGIFTGLLHDLGVKGLEVEELWGLDAELLKQLEPVHALVFLFKWVGGATDKMDGTFVEAEEGTYFAHQVINNACASIALLNATLNIRAPHVEHGEELENLSSFSYGLDAQTRGEIITNSQKIREVHNSFARSDPFHLEDNQPQSESDRDAFHFISYVPINGQLFELDGLKKSPVSHGKIPEGSDWTDLAREVLERRIASYPPGEVMFNLLALTSRLSSLRAQLSSIESKSSDERTDDEAVKISDLSERIGDIEARVRDWETENTLRRHNYIGLVHAVLVEMAKQGQLKGRIDEAKATMKKKVEERKAKGIAMDED
ncbi:ubiquitin carboxyl-terminal hydrolase [Sporobolomyces salmoneus]|uniref:ubiquitin carboxyl-terminal hydrolase n=1 Tax=Sporobolomyces salmoneus TaxID=183962 RepID=UPI0031704792